jgi:hypothetical protein
MGWIDRQRKSIRETKEMFTAMWRQGLHELGRALYGADSVAQPPEYGMPWTKTPGQVSKGMEMVQDLSAVTPTRQATAVREPNPTDAYLARPSSQVQEQTREAERPAIERD